MEFLSDEWVARLRDLGAALPEHPGATLRCQHEVSGAPAGKVRFYCVWVDGRLTDAAIGKLDDADVQIQAKAPDALDVLSGAKELEVSFMQGRVKVDGDYRRLLVDLRGWRSTPEVRSLLAELAGATD